MQYISTISKPECIYVLRKEKTLQFSALKSSFVTTQNWVNQGFILFWEGSREIFITWYFPLF